MGGAAELALHQSNPSTHSRTS